MWAQYKSTFLRIQVVIFSVSAAIYTLFGHHWEMAIAFFLVMEVSAVIGARWAARLKAMLARDAEGLLKPPH